MSLSECGGGLSETILRMNPLNDSNFCPLPLLSHLSFNEKTEQLKYFLKNPKFIIYNLNLMLYQ